MGWICWWVFVPYIAAPPPLAQLLPGQAAGGGDDALKAAQRDFGWDALWKWQSLYPFLLVVCGALAVGAVLAYHPVASRRASLEDLDQPKTIITYTLVGALVAIVVAASPSMALGLVIFGIGGLMRFRTETGPAKDTGRVILALILGITCGLKLWMPAILGTAIAWLLIAALEWRIGMRMVVRFQPVVTGSAKAMNEAAEAYAGVLRSLGCRFSTPRKNPLKGQVSYILRARRGLEREAIEAECKARVPEHLHGTIDWPEE